MKSLRNVFNPNNINESLNSKIRIKPRSDPKHEYARTCMAKKYIKNACLLPSMNYIENAVLNEITIVGVDVCADIAMK